MRTGRRRLAALALSALSALSAISVAALVVAAPGCARRHARGDLSPPTNAAAWDSRFDLIFDDYYTQTPLELSGRAPGDVIDQQRLAQRLGFADIVALVTVDQVWSRALHDGVPRQRLDVAIDRVLLGALPKGTRTDQLLELRGGDELPAGLTGRVMLMFVRWAPGDGPGYHHHLMPADDNVLDWANAMIRHARALGKLDAVEKPRKQRRNKSRKGSAGGDADGGGADAAPRD